MQWRFIIRILAAYYQCPLQAKLDTDTVTQDYQTQDPLWGSPARAKPVRLGLQTNNNNNNNTRYKMSEQTKNWLLFTIE